MLLEVEAGFSTRGAILEALSAHRRAGDVRFRRQPAWVLAKHGGSRLVAFGNRRERGTTFVAGGAVADEVGGWHPDPLPRRFRWRKRARAGTFAGNGLAGGASETKNPGVEAASSHHRGAVEAAT